MEAVANLYGYPLLLVPAAKPPPATAALPLDELVSAAVAAALAQLHPDPAPSGTSISHQGVHPP